MSPLAPDLGYVPRDRPYTIDTDMSDAGPPAHTGLCERLYYRRALLPACV